MPRARIVNSAGVELPFLTSIRSLTRAPQSLPVEQPTHVDLPEPPGEDRDLCSPTPDAVNAGDPFSVVDPPASEEEWGTGDDEMDFLENEQVAGAGDDNVSPEDEVDIDLTINDDLDAPSDIPPDSTCPICGMLLQALQDLVREPHYFNDRRLLMVA